ncbi:MAG: UDP-N-acetylmuramate--L-alanine ligase [Clostridia bacterium]|nr:UDP-N-acetylmuramate--L-alanine ligase [Clostridia bacterium]
MELEEINSLEGYKRIHLIGIGGISMSAIAETLKVWGYQVTGSDLHESDLTEKLVNDGIEVTIGHNEENTKKADLIVYNAAIPEDDPEMVIAKINHIPTIGRGKFVGFLTRAYNEAICVSGTHGKTTTTSMIACCFVEAGLDPSVEVGAVLKEIGGNYRIGKSEYFILESCEYKGNFLNFSPNSAIILNIDNDHLDYYKTFENVVKAFDTFAGIIDEKGILVTNADDENCLKLKDFTKAKFVTYGIENKEADFTAENITFDDNGFAEFDCLKNGEQYLHVKLSVAGYHNILNAMACIGICDYYNVNKEAIQSALYKFTGASRRLEYKGSFNEVSVFDDYGHHPTEILATANAVKNKKYNQSWVIFQPHTYSRTKEHLKDFAKALSNFDNIVLTDIYAAREIDTGEISSNDIVAEIENLGKKAINISSFEEIVKYVKENANPKDIVITLGAGNVTTIGPMLIK